MAPSEKDIRKNPDISEVLTNLYWFMVGDRVLLDDSRIRQIYMVRDRMQVVTDGGLWEFDVESKRISLLAMY